MIQQPLKVFISYAHEDDEVFDFGAPLQRLLQQLLRSMTNNNVEVFRDRESIQLGADWRQTIEAGVRESMCLLVCYSATYGRRPACREEFFQFQDAAKSAGVGSLLIPLSLVGFDMFPEPGEDPIADYVREHQGLDFTEAWIEGAGSPPFKRAAMTLAQRIIAVHRASEASLAEAELASISAELGTSGTPAAVEAADDEEEPEREADGLYELMSTFHDEVDLLTEEANAFGVSITELGESVESFIMPTDGAPKQMQASLVALAHRLTPHAADMQKHGFALRNHAQQLDTTIRGMRRSVDESKQADLILGYDELIAEMSSSMDSMTEVNDQMSDFLDSLAVPEQLSSALRKSLRPARRGTTAVQDALALFDGWKELTREPGRDGDAPEVAPSDPSS